MVLAKKMEEKEWGEMGDIRDTTGNTREPTWSFRVFPVYV
jgi:hypothetical protein